MDTSEFKSMFEVAGIVAKKRTMSGKNDKGKAWALNIVELVTLGRSFEVMVDDAALFAQVGEGEAVRCLGELLPPVAGSRGYRLEARRFAPLKSAEPAKPLRATA